MDASHEYGTANDWVYPRFCFVGVRVAHCPPPPFCGVCPVLPAVSALSIIDFLYLYCLLIYSTHLQKTKNSREKYLHNGG